MLSDAIGFRQSSLKAASSHLVCWMVIEAITIANAS